MDPAILARIAYETGVPEHAAAEAVALIGEGLAIPFIARYRKDRIGSMDEANLREIQSLAAYYRRLLERRASVSRAIEAAGKLTDELREKIASTFDRDELEDIALPYRSNRKPSEAAGRGLEGLAEYLWAQETDAWSLEEHADVFVDAHKGVPSREAALEGASRIVADWIAESAEVRRAVRERMWKHGKLVSKVVPQKAGEKSKFAMYFDRSESLAKIPSHRVLAIRRGSKEGILTSAIETDAESIIASLVPLVIRDRESVFAPVLEAALRDAYTRLVRPSIDAEIRAKVKERADNEAIRVFQANLANLLLSPAAGRIVVAGLHRAKGATAAVAVVDAAGKLLESATLALEPENVAGSRAALKEIGGRHSVAAITVAAGAGGREVEIFARKLVEEEKVENVFVATVTDAGLAVYATSREARAELPDLDTPTRVAVSLARRLQDPLSELVKIDPKAIGVGQYQHDVHQRELERRLLQTVVSCVSRVGVDCNSAPQSLLRHVAGLGDSLARRIVEHRTTNGSFASREALRTVAEMTDKSFLESAGFLRILVGENALDVTAIHPEHYPVVERIAAGQGVAPAALLGRRDLLETERVKELAGADIGPATLSDLRDELLHPGRDPRRPFSVPRFREGVRELADLKEGMTLDGTVTNVTNFGAFVDVGVNQDGLVHLSQMSNRFIRDPREAVHVGDVVSVKVLSVEVETRRIGLSMKALLPPPQRRRKKPARERPAAPAPDAEQRAQPPLGPRPARPRVAPRAAPARPGAEPAQKAADGARPRPRRGPRRPERPSPGPEAGLPPPPPAPEAPPEPARTLEEKIAILQSKFRGAR